MIFENLNGFRESKILKLPSNAKTTDRGKPSFEYVGYILQCLQVFLESVGGFLLRFLCVTTNAVEFAMLKPFQVPDVLFMYKNI